MKNAKNELTPQFDPAFISRHITPEWVATMARERLDRARRGEEPRHLGRRIDKHELDTGEAAVIAMPHTTIEKRLDGKIIDILSDLREAGLLSSIPHGADRGIHEAVEWNAFIENSRAGEPKFGWNWIFRAPLLRLIEWGISRGSHDVLDELRQSRGLKDRAADRREAQVGEAALMPLQTGDLEKMAAAAAEKAAFCGSGQDYPALLFGASILCPKTDDHLLWGTEPEDITRPTIHRMDNSNGYRTEPIGPWLAPKPIRHIELDLHSGILMMADWFRIPGFNEGVGKPDYSKPGINSDLGVDLRTEDQFKRLGLMQIQTTNCVPAVIADGDLTRIAWFDEDNEAYWGSGTDKPDNAVNQVGSVCCDLWSVTFADKVVLKNILKSGDADLSDDDADLALEAYAKSWSVCRLEFEPGTRLHLYMATGHGSTEFHQLFKSEDLDQKPWIEDYFILSRKPLSVDPELVDECGWKAPEIESGKPAPFHVGPGL